MNTCSVRICLSSNKIKLDISTLSFWRWVNTNFYSETSWRNISLDHEQDCKRVFFLAQKWFIGNMHKYHFLHVFTNNCLNGDSLICLSFGLDVNIAVMLTLLQRVTQYHVVEESTKTPKCVSYWRYIFFCNFEAKFSTLVEYYWRNILCLLVGSNNNYLIMKG